MNNLVKGCTFLILVNSSYAATTVAVEPGISGHELIKILSGLLAVIVLILVFSWILKRLNHFGIGKNNNLRVLACTSLGARERILLVHVGDRYLLLGVAAGSINTLCDFGSQIPEGFNPHSQTGFKELLKTALRKSG